MKRWMTLVAVLALTVGACTGDGGETTTSAAAPPDTGTEAPETTTPTTQEETTTTGAPTAEADGTIIIGTTDTISPLDPADAYAIHDWELLKNINEGLLRWSPGELELVPGAAAGMPEVSNEGLTYTVSMRDDVPRERRGGRRVDHPVQPLASGGLLP